MKRATTSAAILATLALAATVACDGTPVDTAADRGAAASITGLDPMAAPADASSGAQAPDLARMRAGSAAYRTFDRALEDGFIPLSPCVEEAPGGMGFHYGHPERLAAIEPDASMPEILLYAPTADGRMELVGVEFMVNAGAWHAAGNTGAPSLAGVAYADPNPHHPDPNVAASYTLHVWNWKANPSGMFAPFNPDVTCSP